MSTQRIKLFLLVIPTLIVIGFEYLRHTYCVPFVSLATGNWLIAAVTALSISLISQGLFHRFEQTERTLSTEREARAIMEERERLARELHDRIAQSIFYTGVQVEALRKKSMLGNSTGNREVGIASEPLAQGDEMQEWNEVLLALREMDENVRQAIFNLRQDTTSTFNLKERIERYLENAFHDLNVTMSVNLDEDVSFLETAEQIQLFGILQEAVTNIHKHASATAVIVKLSRCTKQGTWLFQVSDNGVGFDPKERRGHQYGLDIMTNRAEEIGAKAMIESDRHGTSVKIMKEDHSHRA